MSEAARAPAADVLAVNEAFYRAFAARDLTAMDKVWARAIEVVCIHPGWAPLFGRDAVMQSWAGILGNPQSPNIRCLESKASLLGDIAMVVCHEVVEQGYLVATNLFARESGAWKLFHHQSGPTSAAPADPAVTASSTSKRIH